MESGKAGLLYRVQHESLDWWGDQWWGCDVMSSERAVTYGRVLWQAGVLRSGLKLKGVTLSSLGDK